MSGSLNRCEFIGRLGADPEQRETNGGPVVNMRIAVSERYKDREGNRQERTTWVPIVIWNEKLGEIAMKYLNKGGQCFIAGEFSVRKYTDQSGQEKYTTEVVLQRYRGELTLLGGRDDGGHEQRQERSTSPADRHGNARGSAQQSDNDDLDEIPFNRQPDEMNRRRQSSAHGITPAEV